jgi:hypothetical protein
VSRKKRVSRLFPTVRPYDEEQRPARYIKEQHAADAAIEKDADREDARVQAKLEADKAEAEAGAREQAAASARLEDPQFLLAAIISSLAPTETVEFTNPLSGQVTVIERPRTPPQNSSLIRVVVDLARRLDALEAEVRK